MELTKESKSHPLSAFFRVLAHFTRVVGGLEPDYTFITAQQNIPLPPTLQGTGRIGSGRPAVI